MRRGWCPTAHEPMPTGDGLLARVKPPLGRLAAAAARTLADGAARFGNGIVELTGRGSLQVRGLADGDAAPFAAAMVAAGLAHADADAERRRNVLVSPLAGDDPAVAPETIAVALAAEAALVARPDLPPKFHVAVCGGGVLPLHASADVVVRLASGTRGERDAVGFHPYAGRASGAFGLGVPFGQTDAATLRALAALAERFGDGLLRLSPWRAVLLGGVTDPLALADAAPAGLIVAADDPRRRVFACIGAPGCASRAASPFEGILHVSGCAKGCAHPRPAATTLVGERGGYRIVRNGRAA